MSAKIEFTTDRDKKVFGKATKKTPRSGTQLAQLLGFASHHSIARSLNRLVGEGKLRREGKGYVKAV